MRKPKVNCKGSEWGPLGFGNSENRKKMQPVQGQWVDCTPGSHSHPWQQCLSRDHPPCHHPQNEDTPSNKSSYWNRSGQGVRDLGSCSWVASPSVPVSLLLEKAGVDLRCSKEPLEPSQRGSSGQRSNPRLDTHYCLDLA